MKPKIRMVGFSTSDMARGHAFAIAAGFLAALVGLGIGGYGATGRATIAELASLSTVAQSTAGAIATSAQSGGATAQLPMLSGQLRSVAAGLESVGVPTLVPSQDAKTQAVAFASAWADLSQAMNAMERPTADAEALRKQVASAMPALVLLGRKIEPYRNTPAGGLAFESVSRLQGYASSGFGYEASERVGYDLTSIVYQLRANEGAFGAEARQLAETIYRDAAGLAAQAKSSKPPEKVVATLSERAKVAQARAVALRESLKAADDTGVMLMAGGGVLVVAGLLIVMTGVLLAVSEYGSRFRKSLGQFNRNEGALVRLGADAKAVAGGDLNTVADADDEGTAEIALALNEITLQVRALIERATRQSEAANKFARDVGEGAGAAEARLAIQANGIAELLESLQSMAANMQWLSHDAKAAQYAARATLESLHIGSRAVQDSVDRMDSIRDAMQDTSKRIKRLGERSQEVGAVLDDLSSLSEQINVLAMNAALEAERAGEAGRGFRVVSAEVKNLSVRVEGALARATEAAETMQSDARFAIESMERSTQKVASSAYVGEVAAASLMMSRGSVDSLVAMSSLLAQDAFSESETAAHGAGSAKQAASTAAAEIEWVQAAKKSSREAEADVLAATRALEGMYK